MVRVLLIALIFISSCAVKKKSCDIIYEDTLKNQQKLPEKYEAKGLVYIKNIPAIFKANFSNEEYVKLYTIFGQKLGEIKKEDDLICINFKGLNQCGDKSLYSKLLGVDIPQELKNILIGKVSISKNARYYCRENDFVIEDKNIKYIFKNGKLREIIYDIYKLSYKYYSDKTVIEIFANEKEIGKIEIKKVKAL